MPRGPVPDEQATRRDIADSQDGHVLTEERRPDRNSHPERMDRPAPREQERFVGLHPLPAEEASHALETPLGDPDAPPIPSIVHEGGRLHLATVGPGSDTIAAEGRMEAQQIEARVRAAYGAIAGASDPRPAFSDDVVWHVPGSNPVSGVYRGAEEYFGTMVERMAPLDEWRIVVGDIFMNERDRAALVSFHLVGSRRGVDVDMNGFHIVRLDDDGLIIEGWGFAEDQGALDRFFSA